MEVKMKFPLTKSRIIGRMVSCTKLNGSWKFAEFFYFYSFIDIQFLFHIHSLHDSSDNDDDGGRKHHEKGTF